MFGIDDIRRQAFIWAGRVWSDRPAHWRSLCLAEQLRFTAIAFSPTHSGGLSWWESLVLIAWPIMPISSAPPGQF